MMYAQAIVLTSILVGPALSAPLEPGMSGDVALDLRATRSAIVAGKALELVIGIRNVGDRPTSVPKGLDVRHGGVSVWVAYQGEEFREYVGPRWGLSDAAGGEGLALAPRDSIEERITILYNHGHQTDELNDERQRLPTGYAMKRAGTYRIKAICHLNDRDVESEPIAIEVLAPKGIDAAVWAQLSENGDAGYFLQTGDIRKHPDSLESKTLIKMFHDLNAANPQSSYAVDIESALKKYDDRLGALRRRGIVLGQ